MAQTAMNELQQQIEQVRREAFAAGYAAAMQAIRELASRAAPIAGLASARSRGSTTARRTAITPATRRRAHRSEGLARSRRSAGSRPQLGSNAQEFEKVLQAAAPRALRQAEIRKILQEKGVEVSFTSFARRSVSWRRATPPSRSATPRPGATAAADEGHQV